jgi:hypothetical protein
MTGERLDPCLIQLVPPLAALTPPAIIIDKSHYSPLTAVIAFLGGILSATVSRSSNRRSDWQEQARNWRDRGSRVGCPPTYPKLLVMPGNMFLKL